jgi:D-3-phosphoglycerate dehydrogenase
MIKVLLADKLSPRAVELLKEIPEFDTVENTGLPADILKQQIQDFDAVIIRSATRLTRPVLEQAKQLKIIVRAGIGLDNIDLDYAGNRGIEVRNTPFATSITVAEYTLSQMLGYCRFIGPAYQSMKAHRWDKKLFSKGSELYGKTAGIIGFGRIGTEVAKRELAMGMKVIFYDVVEIETDLDVQQVSLETLLADSDFISIHLPLTESSKNMISREQLKKMKSSAVLINVARGGVVDEKALKEALENNVIKAAVVDVYEQEPPASFGLIDLENVYPAPHLGASTVEGQERAGVDAVSILKEFFNV